MTCYDIPRGNGKTLDDVINELQALPYIEVTIGEKAIPVLVQVERIQQIIDDLKELRNAEEELK